MPRLVRPCVQHPITQWGGNHGILHSQHGPHHVRDTCRVPVAGLPRGFRFGGQRHLLRPDRHRIGLVLPGVVSSPPAACIRHHGQRYIAGCTVLYLHGIDPGTVRHGGGSARDDRTVVWPAARRTGHCRGTGRRNACRDHGCGLGVGHLYGVDLSAHHAALRLRSQACHRGDRRIGHLIADNSTVAGVNHPGRSIGSFHRRYVSWRHRAGLRTHRAVHILCDRAVMAASQRGSRNPRRGAFFRRTQWQPGNSFAAGPYGGRRYGLGKLHRLFDAGQCAGR